MLCSLALVPLDLVDSCLAIVEEKANELLHEKKKLMSNPYSSISSQHGWMVNIKKILELF